MSFRHLAICLLLVVLPLSRSPLAADELPAWTPIGPYGGNVQALSVSPVLPNLVLAGLQQGSGIFKSTDRSKRWGPATGTFGRNVLDLAIDAKGKAFYAATYEGLFKSTDGGVRWTTLEGATAPTYTFVATHPSKAAIVFGDRGGEFWRSTNGGVTRTVIEGPMWVTKIVFAVSGRRTVMYAGSVIGLWKSDDEGRTWTAVGLPFASPPEVEAVAVDPVDPRVLYIGLHAENVLLKSLDGGATWRLSQRGLPAAQPFMVQRVSELAVDRTNPAIVHAVVDGAIFRSLNRGHDWSRPVPGFPGGYVNDLKTTGYGVLAATAAGVLLSTDRGLTWQLRTAGMSATWITGMGLDHQEPARLYASTLLAGLFKTANQGRSWLRLGDLRIPPNGNQPLAVDPDDPNVVYTTTDTAIAKSTNGGRRWTALTPFSCVDFTRIALDPRVPDHVFASGETDCPYPNVCTLFLSPDAGETWACQGYSIDQLTLLGIDPFTSAVYARARFADLVRSTDDGETWTPLYAGLSPLSFAASPLVEGTLWAGQGNAVARSRDGGQTWQAFSAGLPSGEHVVGLAPDPVDPETLYAATERSGVFKSTDAGETWNLAGLWPSGVVYLAGLLVDPGDPEVVYAGTFGLGVLRLDQSGD
jgi:photosystem II stability/assembly factor-like uncharacterized protein